MFSLTIPLTEWSIKVYMCITIHMWFNWSTYLW